MKFNKFIKTKFVFDNKYILYFVFLMAIVEVIYLIGTNQLYLLILFIISALSISLYNKNMTIILFISIIFINLVKYGSQLYIRENYEGSDTVVAGTDPSQEVSDALKKKQELNNELQDVIKKINEDNNILLSQIKTIKSADESNEQLSNSLQTYDDLRSQELELLTQVNTQNTNLKNAIVNAQLQITNAPQT